MRLFPCPDKSGYYKLRHYRAARFGWRPFSVRGRQKGPLQQSKGGSEPGKVTLISCGPLDLRGQGSDSEAEFGLLQECGSDSDSRITVYEGYLARHQAVRPDEGTVRRIACDDGTLVMQHHFPPRVH